MIKAIVIPPSRYDNYKGYMNGDWIRDPAKRADIIFLRAPKYNSSPAVLNAQDVTQRIEPIRLGMALLNDSIISKLKKIQEKGQHPVTFAPLAADMRKNFAGEGANDFSETGGIIVGQGMILFCFEATQALGFKLRDIVCNYGDRDKIKKGEYEYKIKNRFLVKLEKPFQAKSRTDFGRNFDRAAGEIAQGASPIQVEKDGVVSTLSNSSDARAIKEILELSKETGMDLSSLAVFLRNSAFQL